MSEMTEMYVCDCKHMYLWKHVYAVTCSSTSPPNTTHSQTHTRVHAVESGSEQCYVALFPQWKPVPGQKLQWKFPPHGARRNTRRERGKREQRKEWALSVKRREQSKETAATDSGKGQCNRDVMVKVLCQRRRRGLLTLPERVSLRLRPAIDLRLVRQLSKRL